MTKALWANNVSPGDPCDQGFTLLHLNLRTPPLLRQPTGVHIFRDKSLGQPHVGQTAFPWQHFTDGSQVFHRRSLNTVLLGIVRDFSSREAKIPGSHETGNWSQRLRRINPKPSESHGQHRLQPLVLGQREASIFFLHRVCYKHAAYMSGDAGNHTFLELESPGEMHRNSFLQHISYFLFKPPTRRPWLASAWSQCRIYVNSVRFIFTAEYQF